MVVWGARVAVGMGKEAAGLQSFSSAWGAQVLNIMPSHAQHHGRHSDTKQSRGMS